MADGIEQYLEKKCKDMASQTIDNTKLIQSMYSEIKKRGQLSPTDLQLCLHQYTLLAKLDLLLEIYKDNFYNQATPNDQAGYKLAHEHIKELLKIDGKAFVDILCQMCNDNNTLTEGISQFYKDI